MTIIFKESQCNYHGSLVFSISKFESLGCVTTVSIGLVNTMQL
jgi:hypothetical protein